ncbi:MAG TPA: tetratricopeptide repeat protein [Rectinemataceae bacterium]|nr:tetratricopeptide repeat protein [Rectinemataceae bacterium]
MSTTKRIGLLPIAILAFSLTGCSFFSTLFGLNKDQTQTPALTVTDINTMIGEMSKALSAKASCSPSETTIISDGAKAAVSVNGAIATDFDTLIPVAVGGAVGSLQAFTAPAMTDERKITCVNVIVESFVVGLDGKFEATSRSRSTRQLTASAVAVNALLARISKAAVSNLAKTGISVENRGTVAGEVVSTMIGSLKDGGVNKVLVSDALGKITQAAVQTLKEAGLTESAALQSAVMTITEGAVAAVSSLAVEGVAAADYPALTTQIANGAASAIDAIATTAEDAKGLVGAVASGSAKGAIAAATNGGLSIDAGTLAAMVRGASSGATTGVMSLTLLDVQSIGLDLVSAITSSASTALAGAASAAGFDEKTVQEEVARGAAAAAQTALTGSHDAAALAGAITINATIGIYVDITTAISDGIAIGTNAAPVASAGIDQSAQVGILVTLTATATDEDGDAMTFLWSTVAKPSTASVTLSAADAAITTFTPEVAGIYVFSIKVSDGKAIVETFCTVNVVVDTNATYQGMTAADRMSLAMASWNGQEWGSARDQFYILVTYYPENTLSAEATYYLANTYGSLGMIELAKSRYQEVLDKFPGSAIVPTAKDELAWIYAGAYSDYVTATTMFNELKDLQTRDGADAIHGLGYVAMRQGNFSTAIDLNTQARDSTWADYKVRFYSQQNIGGIYGAQMDYANAEAAFTSLATDPKYTRKVTSDSSTLDMDFFFQAKVSLGWCYNDQGLVQQRADFFLACRDDTSIPYENWMRMRFARFAAEAYIWDLAQTVDSWNQAASILSSSIAGFSGNDFATKGELDWVNLRLGQAYVRLTAAAKNPTETKTFAAAAIAAFGLAETDLGTAWGTRQAGEAMAEHASIYIWRTPDYNLAEALLAKLASTYPTDADQYPRAYSYHLLGTVYMERGNDAIWNYGQDYVAYFNTAIGYFSKVARDRYPILDKKTWFFRDAARYIGDCLYGLKQYDNAIAQLTPLLSDQYFLKNPADLAWVKLDIANAHGERIRQLSNEGRFSEIAALQSAAVQAFEDAGNYQVDGAYPRNGEISASAWCNLGYVFHDVAWQMESYGFGDGDGNPNAAIVADTWQAGHDALAKVTWANYPALDTTKWFFPNSFIALARCLEGLGRWKDPSNWAKAHEQFAAIIGYIDAGKLSSSLKPKVLQKDAEAYQEQTYGLPWTSEYAPQRIDLDNQAIAAFQKVLDLGKDYDNGSGAAIARGDMVESYLDLSDLSTMNWPGDVAGVALRNGYIAAVNTLLTAPGAFTTADDSTLVNEGKGAARGYYRYGSILRMSADIYCGLVQDGSLSDPSWLGVCLAWLDESIAACQTVESFPGAEPFAVMGSRRVQVQAYLSQSRFLLLGESPDVAKAALCFGKAIDATASCVTDDASLVQYPARAFCDLGWACLNWGGPLIGTLPEFPDQATLLATAKLYFQTVTVTYPAYAAVDGGSVGQSCEEGLAQIAALE